MGGNYELLFGDVLAANNSAEENESGEKSPHAIKLDAVMHTLFQNFLKRIGTVDQQLLPLYVQMLHGQKRIRIRYVGLNIVALDLLMQCV
jgi:hypothetical protein